MTSFPRISADERGSSMSRFTTAVEEISGLLSFWVGLLYLFIAGEMAFYVHGVAAAMPVVGVAVWSIALLVASRRAGRGVVMFRIVSLAILLIGTVMAALFLQPWARFKS